MVYSKAHFYAFYHFNELNFLLMTVDLCWVLTYCNKKVIRQLDFINCSFCADNPFSTLLYYNNVALTWENKARNSSLLSETCHLYLFYSSFGFTYDLKRY